jgi:hypothetical protein
MLSSKVMASEVYWIVLIVGSDQYHLIVENEKTSSGLSFDLYQLFEQTLFTVV